MSGLRRSLHLLCPVLLFLIGLSHLLYYATGWWTWIWAEKIPVAIHHWMDRQMDSVPWYSWIAWWTLLMVIPLALLVLRMRAASRLLVLRTDSTQPLKIRQEAVNRYIHDRLLALPFVRRARVASHARGGGLALRVRVWVASRKPLSNLQETVLHRITEDARRGFGISKIHTPDVHFESVQTAKGEGPEPEAEPAEPAETFAPLETRPATETPKVEGSGETRSITERRGGR